MKQICAVCGKSQRVPEDSQTNMCTVKVIHHYGSPKDGDTETYDICLECIQKTIKAKPIAVKSDW